MKTRASFWKVFGCLFPSLFVGPGLRNLEKKKNEKRENLSFHIMKVMFSVFREAPLGA